MSGDEQPDSVATVRVAYGSEGVAQIASGRHVVCRFRRSVGRPCCGDRVRLEPADGHSFAVAAILPRRNEFVRGDARQRRQIIASNLDRVLIVIAPQPAPSRDLVERYLVAVHSLGIEPVLVVNKAELLAGSAALREAPFGRLDQYRDLGYTVVQTSCKGAPGVDALLPLLHDATGILVGQSGVGKSALVNRLIPDLELQTGELSATTGKGTHTTTMTMLYTLPGGGALIDSPGVWEYGLWKMSPTEIAAGFHEFDTLSGRCRFNDCRHAGEPGCAVAEAAAAGRIHAWRLDSFRRLLAQS